MTVEQAEDLRRARLAAAWTMFGAGLLAPEVERPRLDVVDGGRVGRRRGPRRNGGYGSVAA